MHFTLSDDQQEIKDTAHSLLEARSPMTRVRELAEAGGYDDALWAEVTELGWPGIAVAEEHGGQGLGMVELAAVLEELGYACAVTPMLGTVLAAEAIGHAGSAAQRDRWLPGLAAGESTGAVGVERDGVAELVADGPPAAVIVVVDEAAGEARAVAADEAEVTATETIDPTRSYARVAAPAGAGEPLESADAVRDRAAVALSAELVGLCQRALDMTIAYVKDRRQFGVPIGAFQAVQHTAAEMLRHTEAARSATYYAAWTADAEPERLPLASSMAKVAASDASRAVTASAIQLHGGIGFTWEADVHWLFKRAQIGSRLFGGAAAHRARVTRLAAAERAVTSR